MGPVELRLIPAPGAKPEFLASVEPMQKEVKETMLWQQIASLNKVLLLEGYTRDPWAVDTSLTTWSSLQVRSVDGRNKLPGFVKYLRERQKTCFGRFIMKGDKNSESGLTTFVWVISHKQTSSSQLSCRVASIDSIPKCPLRPKSATTGRPPPAAKVAAAVAAKPQASTTTTNNNNNNNNNNKPKKKGFGLLGNLVGAQKRTNHQVVTANSAAATGKTQKLKTAADINNKNNDSNNTASQQEDTADSATSAMDNSEPLVTSGKILSDFRHEMEQKMLDFDIAPDMSMKIQVKLSDHTKNVQESDKGKITMEVLKYIVYEQAEEVNEEWIPYKEPSEFTDEVTIAIYKDAESAPPEVMEEVNRAELPEEARIQQNASEQKRREQEAKALKIQEMLQRQALRKMAASAEDQEGGGGLSKLNTEKRDLRTIEEIQQGRAKRRKLE
eukprot:CAMPEP_0116155422 /NCGR_PEP_ID=MMETSP0329-20121206/22301_1 /TAXON_ID=697910 /ORGANISM="Pseudo-nitzschia arenysensis, Strain B593" /LENGTH=441 /DNA_ID=CAMNT_0003652459 /DNA_START=49 /DNA_END=1374 /DNA_ORIENTATION=-